MKRTLFTIFSVFAFVLFAVLVYFSGVIGNSPLSPASGDGRAFAQEKGASKAIFKVKCYDEGKAALRGLKGIQKIETGFHYIHETDTVYFDPKLITIEEMEAALKKAGTYVETVTEKERK
jgi:copper chaperone CopZ